MGDSGVHSYFFSESTKEKVEMANGSRSVQVSGGQVEEKLNHLEYVVDGTVRSVTHLKKGPLKEQTTDFLELMGIVKDAIATYRDEVADQKDAESGENIT
jgi:hypothetical protein